LQCEDQNDFDIILFRKIFKLIDEIFSSSEILIPIFISDN